MNRNIIVSVIITTKNEERVLPRLLESIKKQTFRKFEVILVDNFSADNTARIADKYHVKYYTFGPERSAQRNFGAKNSKGKYLFFVDADMVLTAGVIENCILGVERGDFGGMVIPEQSIAINFWGKVKAFERSFYNEKGDPITDAARFFPRQVFFKVGGYDDTITGPEDWDLPDRIREVGYEIGRSSEKIYHNELEISPIVLFKKKFYYGINAYRYLSKRSIPVISPKTIYFLRPLFYKNWVKLLRHPILSMAMVYMLSIELMGGGLGYLVGRFNNR